MGIYPSTCTPLTACDPTLYPTPHPPQRILTPSQPIDVLSDVRECKRRGEPYMMVFLGVNGVGKSTNLAKVAYWFLQCNHSVMVAGCDTFRSGAVEQLATHCRRLNIPLFQRGYSKDPAEVAADAMKAAKKQVRGMGGIGVVGMLMWGGAWVCVGGRDVCRGVQLHGGRKRHTQMRPCRFSY